MTKKRTDSHYEEVGVRSAFLITQTLEGWGLHNTQRPAYIEYFAEGQILSEDWYKNGYQHRDKKPSHKWYRTPRSSSKGLCLRQWYLNGVLQRTKKSQEETPSE